MKQICQIMWYPLFRVNRDISSEHNFLKVCVKREHDPKQNTCIQSRVYGNMNRRQSEGRINMNPRQSEGRINMNRRQSEGRINCLSEHPMLSGQSH
jgi:hypothetical protein